MNFLRASGRRRAVSGVRIRAAWAGSHTGRHREIVSRPGRDSSIYLAGCFRPHLPIDRTTPPTMLLYLQTFLHDYWPHFVFLFTLVAAATAATHAAMNKTDVRAAIGWVGIILLSPLFGAFFYLIAGINRVRHDQISQQRDKSLRDYSMLDDSPVADVTPYSAPQFASLQTLGDSVSSFPLCDGNHIQLLCSGDETYPAMVQAIESAKVSVALQTYIFDNDQEGRKIVDALARAVKRGVQVRVL